MELIPRAIAPTRKGKAISFNGLEIKSKKPISLVGC